MIATAADLAIALTFLAGVTLLALPSLVGRARRRPPPTDRISDRAMRPYRDQDGAK